MTEISYLPCTNCLQAISEVVLFTEMVEDENGLVKDMTCPPKRLYKDLERSYRRDHLVIDEKFLELLRKPTLRSLVNILTCGKPHPCRRTAQCRVRSRRGNGSRRLVLNMPQFGWDDPYKRQAQPSQGEDSQVSRIQVPIPSSAMNYRSEQLWTIWPQPLVPVPVETLMHRGEAMMFTGQLVLTRDRFMFNQGARSHPVPHPVYTDNPRMHPLVVEIGTRSEDSDTEEMPDTDGYKEGKEDGGAQADDEASDLEMPSQLEEFTGSPDTSSDSDDELEEADDADYLPELYRNFSNLSAYMHSITLRQQERTIRLAFEGLRRDLEAARLAEQDPTEQDVAERLAQLTLSRRNSEWEHLVPPCNCNYVFCNHRIFARMLYVVSNARNDIFPSTSSM